MKRLSVAILFIVSFFYGFSQGIEGEWETYDDKTGAQKSVVEIYKKGAIVYGKVIQKFEGPEDASCAECKGSKKGQKILGMVIIENMKLDGGEYSGGTITDPESGNEYKCLLQLLDSNKLKVRGYIGFSLLGRTQYWLRKKKS